MKSKQHQAAHGSTQLTAPMRRVEVHIPTMKTYSFNIFSNWMTIANETIIMLSLLDHNNLPSTIQQT